MGGAKRSESDISNIYLVYSTTSVGLDEVAQLHHIDYRTLKRYFAQYKLPLKTPAHFQPNNEKLTQALATALHARYMGGESAAILADEAGVNVSTLHRTFARLGLEEKSPPAIQREKVERARETSTERYGVDWPTKSADVRQKLVSAAKKIDWSAVTLKRIATCRDVYGVDNPSQSSIIKAQKVETSVRNYGVPHPQQCESVKQQMRETKWAERWGRLEPSLEQHGYKMLEPYAGHYFRENGKHIAYKRYQILHTVCGHIFSDDVFELPRCPECYPAHVSLQQCHYETFVKDLLTTDAVRQNDTLTIRNPVTNYPLELDIHIPDRKIAFEYNGVIYHSADVKDANYHAVKTNLCLEQGISLYHIWEFNPPHIVESRIRSLLGLSALVSARNLEFCTLTAREADVFLTANHLHGACVCSHAYGLHDVGGTLVAVLTFRKTQHNDVLEIARFCSQTGISIRGGFQKLLHNSIPLLPESINSIITYADRDWTPDPSKAVYAKAGFVYEGDSGPILRYADLKNQKIHSRLTFQKHKLKDLFPSTYRDELTAVEILQQNKIIPLYNSGNHKFSLEVKR